MTSSPTREVDPDMLSAVLADHDERRPCPTPCRDQSERGGCLCAITAATLRALHARAEAAERERDALRDEWEEIAAGITTEIPAVGALWPLVSEISGSLCAARLHFRNEIEAHNRTKAERDAARAEAARLREALTFYANPQVYAPHPHGPAFDRRDLSWHARAALAGEAGCHE